MLLVAVMASCSLSVVQGTASHSSTLSSSLFHSSAAETARTASSRPLPPHRRAHIPTNLQYTCIRKHPTAAGQNHVRRSPGLGGSFGSSTPLPPSHNKRSTPPLPFEVLNGSQHTPEHSDTILVQFQVPSADDDGYAPERISMLLRPTEDLIHPNAKVVYNSVDPETGLSTDREEPLFREDVLAYSGVVLHEKEVSARLAEAKIGLRTGLEQSGNNRGWARLMLSNGRIGETLAEGAFSIDGEVHHLKTLENYRNSRRYPENYEPHFHARHLQDIEGDAGGSGLVLLRDRDLDHHAHQHAKRAGGLHSSNMNVERRSSSSLSTPSTNCGHDSLSYNTDLEHPVYRDARQMAFDAQFSRKEGWLDSILGGISPSSHLTSGLAGRNYGHGQALSKRQSNGAGDLAGAGNMSSNYINSIGKETGCPKTNKVLYMGLAADCTYTSHYGSQNATRTQML